jgi:hypothetical protein
MTQKYSLEVISHHNDSKNKSMRQYSVEGINTIGVFGNEPFEVRFKNHTYSKVLVKLSIDGTDVLTGEKANTEITKDIWVVQGYGTLSLKAWPESNNGGAQLVFTNGGNSVAVHTHGDLSSRGIIAAAVYEEGHVEPLRFNNEHHYYHHYYPSIWTTWYNLGDNSFRLGDSSGSFQVQQNNVYTSNSADFSGSYSASSSISCSNVAPRSLDAVCESAAETNVSKGLESLVAVGAGEYVNQEITHTSGLIKPFYAETVRVRYLWWDDLKAKLSQNNWATPHGTGFPGDKPKLNLGKTPRIGAGRMVMSRAQQPLYSRF